MWITAFERKKNGHAWIMKEPSAPSFSQLPDGGNAVEKRAEHLRPGILHIRKRQGGVDDWGAFFSLQMCTPCPNDETATIELLEYHHGASPLECESSYFGRGSDPALADIGKPNPPVPIEYVPLTADFLRQLLALGTRGKEEALREVLQALDDPVYGKLLQPDQTELLRTILKEYLVKE